MFQETYEWYLSQLDDEYPEHMELARHLKRIVNPSIRTTSVTKPKGMTDAEYMQSRFDRFNDRAFAYTKGVSKWDRIGKPFVEEMVTFNRRLHFWNPIGRIIGAVELHMQQNPDWDDLSTY